MNHITRARVRIGVGILALLILSLPLSATSYYFEEQRALVVRAPGWSTDLVADGHPSYSASVPVTNCCVPAALSVVPYGGAVAEHVEGLVTGGSFVALNTGAAVTNLYTIARHAESGTTMYIPASAASLTDWSQRVRAGHVRNGGGYVTALILINEGARGWLTIEVRNAANVEIGREWVLVENEAWYELRTPVEIGSVVVTQGYRPIDGTPSDPSTAPGRVWGWVSTAPRSSGPTAPLVRPWTPYQVAPVVTHPTP